MRAVAGLGAGQMKAQRIAIPVGLEVDLGREAAARAAQCLAALPPLWMARPLPEPIRCKLAVSLRRGEGVEP